MPAHGTGSFGFLTEVVRPRARAVGCWREACHFGRKPLEMPLDSACRRASVLRSYQQELTRPPTIHGRFRVAAQYKMDTRELYSIEEARFMLGGISRATRSEERRVGKVWRA